MKRTAPRRISRLEVAEQRDHELQIEKQQAIATTSAHALLDQLRWNPFRAHAVNLIRKLAALQDAAEHPETSLYSIDGALDPEVVASLDRLSGPRSRPRGRASTSKRRDLESRRVSRGTTGPLVKQARLFDSLSGLLTGDAASVETTR